MTDLDLLAEMPLDLLLRLARREIDVGGDVPQPHLAELHRRPERPVFDRAAELLNDEDATSREFGAAILSRLGDERPFRTEAIPLLRGRLADEEDPDVISQLVYALGNNAAVEDLPAVVRLATHPDAQVRFSVAGTLPGLVNLSAVEPAAAEALFQLCEDEDADVRFYALYAVTRELAALDVHAVEDMTVRLRDDPDDQVRAMALDHRDAIHEARRLLGDDHLIGPALVALASEGGVEELHELGVPDEAAARQLVTWWNERDERWP
ncbi:HEAT repeat domain-containing protein [Actinoplanes sp. NPDC048796]|uniref:HEAT repeat domain-containing protein n=1 Tax=unclassified Actinoplanes TaxID=2626549 RepID=UPI0033E59EEF